MPRLRPPLVPILGVALVLAACSGDDTSTTTTSIGPGATAETTLPSTEPPATTPETTAPDTTVPDTRPEAVPERDARPVIFIHGGSGSGAQFQAQAMRFASNGYPVDRLRVIDYNSTNVAGADVPARLDALIAQLQAETGHDQIDLIGHSLGTVVSSGYLTSDPARAANVAHYVNIDGAALDGAPGGVPTLALWGEAGFGRRTGEEEIPGARNVRFDDQAHVEVATSPEAFAEMFRFFNDGEDPATTDILPQPSEDLTIAGRAVFFPQNEGVPDGRLLVFEVDPATGFRLQDEPAAEFPLSGDGSWGPFDGDFGASYEMVIEREGGSRLHHFYLEPLVRTDHLIRLNTSPPDGGVGALIENHDTSMSIVISRYREWWGDQGAGSDILTVDGVEVVNAATSPRTSNTIGILLFDRAGDDNSATDAPIESIFAIGFLSAVDLAVAASEPPDRTVQVSMTPRGATTARTVNVPNWSSTGHAVSIHFVT